jgi:hypothetical protein
MLPIFHRQEVDMAAGVRLLGWNPPQTNLRPGETLALKLFWQAIPTTSRPLTEIQVSLESETNQNTIIYEGDAAIGYPSEFWTDSELITAPMYWIVPREQPSGLYRLIMTVGESKVEIGNLEIAGTPRVFEAPLVQTELNARFGDSLSLYGYNLEIAEDITLELVWKSLAEVNDNYTVFVHLVAPDGTIVMQHDLMPQNNIYPTSLWLAGEYVRDEYLFTNIPPGQYSLRVGFYRQENGKRLPVISAEPMTDFVEIAPVEFGLESRSD